MNSVLFIPTNITALVLPHV